jgi:hypothetical protein
MGRLQKGSAHEPSPLVRELHGETLGRSQVVGILGLVGVSSSRSFVQQFKRQSTPHARNSLFLQAQGVTQFSELARARNSVTIRATRPLDRGTV